MPPALHFNEVVVTMTALAGLASATLTCPAGVVVSPALTDSWPDLLTAATCVLFAPSIRTSAAEAALASGGPMSDPMRSAPATRLAVRQRLDTCITASSGRRRVQRLA